MQGSNEGTQQRGSNEEAQERSGNEGTQKLRALQAMGGAGGVRLGGETAVGGVRSSRRKVKK